MQVTKLPAEGRTGVNPFSIAEIEGPESFAELLTAFRGIDNGRRPKKGRCFLTLDGLNQCLSTRGHAGEDNGFEDGINYPESSSPRAVAAYYRRLFRAGAAALRNPRRIIPWGSVNTVLIAEPDDIRALVILNKNPDLVLDKRHLVRCLPTDEGADLLAHIPNGYFEGDWNPFECHAVARRLSERHGYEMFGIGASTLGFLSVLDAGERDWDALISDLQELYGHPAAPAWADLAPVLRESPVLLLGYTQEFAEIADDG